MSITAVTTDSLPSDVPRLLPDGVNWGIFDICFSTAIKSKGKWSHFDGSEPHPSPSPDDKATEDPDLAVMKLHCHKTVAEAWAALTKEYTQKGTFTQTQLCTEFLGMRCPDKGDVCAFLDSLQVKKEELASVGLDINDKDYHLTIIGSLPPSLATYANSLLTATKLLSSSMHDSSNIDSDTLIIVISEEYDHQHVQCEHHTAAKTVVKPEKNEAIVVTSGAEKGSKKGPTCWKYSGSAKPKPGGSANAVESSSSDDKFAFAVWEGSDLDSLPDLCSESGFNISNTNELYGGCANAVVMDDKWFSEVDEDKVTDAKVDKDWSHVTAGLGSLSLNGMPINGKSIPDVFRVTSHDPSSPHHVELFDSGCTSHISPYHDDFIELISIGPKPLRAANNKPFSTTAKGELIIDVPCNMALSNLHLTKVFYSLDVGYMLVSVGKLDDAGFEVTFGKGSASSRGKMVPCQALAAKEIVTLEQLHCQMGHISPEVAWKLIAKGFVTGVHLDSSAGKDFFCKSCVYAKSTQKPVAKIHQGEQAKDFAEEVHSNVWGPAPVQTITGCQYYVSFIDNKTCLGHLNFLHLESDILNAFKTFHAHTNTQHSAKIKVLHSDCGGEYTGKEFIAFLNEKGIRQKLTVHDTPQHNGVAEHFNCTILEKVCALLYSSGLPKTLWGKAACHAVWLYNQMSTKALPDRLTPYEAATGKKPNLRDVCEFGEKVWVHVEKGTKLGGHISEGQWLGIDNSSNSAHVYWPENKSVTVECNVYFNREGLTEQLEGEDWELKECSALPSNNATLPSNNATPSKTLQPTNAATEPEPVDAPTCQSTRIVQPSHHVLDLISGQGKTSNRSSDPVIAKGVQLPKPTVKRELASELIGEVDADWMMLIDDGSFLEEYALAAEIADAEGLEPRSVAEAKRRPDWKLWEKAIEDEPESLRKAGTWELVDKPTDVNIVGSKWVFKVKKDAAGNVIKYKARLMAQDYSQVPGIDYFNTFAPVAKLASIQAVLAMAATFDMEIHQIDVKSAFLNGKLESNEVVFMRQPPGYHAPHSANKVCRLIKTLYGLKQSVHVDDCTIVATNLTTIEEVKRGMEQHVKITDLGEIHWLLGIEIKRDRHHHTISLSQRSYIDSILRRYGLEDLKPLSIPMDTQTRLSSSQSPATTAEFAQMRDIPYHEAVGSLMWACLGTRPDIAFAVTTLSRFTKNPGMPHCEAVKPVFHHLKGTKELWLEYGGEEKKELVGYSDADGSMAEDRHAVNGYAFILNCGAILWSCKRQELVSLSTTESEEVFGNVNNPTTLFGDNQSAIALAKDHQYHARTKHIDIRYHFIRYAINEGHIKLIYCPTDDMIADALTKPLPSAKVKHFATEFGLRLA
ncbi:hypothetical protein E4T56_gene198 [Termitomyces sp. T112]|nr:hypothetical protein E4T56_gene198 [Termitomyces sp. T112]